MSFRIFIALALWGLAPAMHADSVELAVVVNLRNPVQTLNEEEIVQLFLFPGTTWSNRGRVRPVDLKTPQWVRSSFYTGVIGRSESAMKIHWARMIFTGAGYPPLELDSVEEVLRYVESNEAAIAYVPRSRAMGRVRQVFVQRVREP